MLAGKIELVFYLSLRIHFFNSVHVSSQYFRRPYGHSGRFSCSAHHDLLSGLYLWTAQALTRKEADVTIR